MQLEDRAPPPPPTHGVPNSTLVFYSDVFILIIIAVFFVFNVPRAILYIANNGSEVFQGYILRSTTKLRMYQSPLGTALRNAVQFHEQEKENPRLASLPPALNLELARKPWHFPMHFSLRHPAASPIQYRVFQNYTLAQVSLMAGYTATIFYVAFYASNPFSNPKRIGWVIASQIPFVYAFATKNNLIGLLVGAGYEKLNYLHRHVGRLMVIAANIHAIGYIYKWSLAGNIWETMALPFVHWGIVALICFDLLGFFSLRSFRMKSYNLFFTTHAIALLVLLVAVCNHQQASIPFVIAASVIYGLDHIIRAIKTRFTAATLRTIPELGLTRVDIPSLNTGWRAGQHVRLRVLSTSMGFWRMFEVHPFTIASAASTEEGLVLMCKKTGNWTRKLYELPQSLAMDEKDQKLEKSIRVMVEGPYGGVGGIMVPSYLGALFVAGGSGVTFALSSLQDLVLAGAKSRAEVIHVVWSVPDPAALEEFIPLFGVLTTRSSPARLHVSVFYTRAISYSLKGLVLPPGVTLTPGRPRTAKILEEFVRSIISAGGHHGAFVGVCGPVMLAKDVADATRTLDGKLKKAIGGIEFHEEVFGL